MVFSIHFWTFEFIKSLYRDVARKPRRAVPLMHSYFRRASIMDAPVQVDKVDLLSSTPPVWHYQTRQYGNCTYDAVYYN